ncbi:MAG: hypothetical protein ACI9SQ_001711 [Rubritalea sp.]
MMQSQENNDISSSFLAYYESLTAFLIVRYFLSCSVT